MKEYIVKVDELVLPEIVGKLIRCKDCKYYEVAELNYDGTPDKRCKPSICANGWYEYAVERDPNWFCADAEPKEGTDEVRKQLDEWAQRKEMERKK